MSSHKNQHDYPLPNPVLAAEVPYRSRPTQQRIHYNTRDRAASAASGNASSNHLPFPSLQKFM